MKGLLRYYSLVAGGFCLAFSATPAVAQLTLDESTLLQVGDEITYSIDLSFEDEDGVLAQAGANQTWVIDANQADGTQRLVAKDPRTDTAFAQFPLATLLLETTNPDNATGFEANSALFMRRSARGLVIIGGTAGNLSDFVPVVRLDRALLYRPASLSFGTVIENTVPTRLTFGPELLALAFGDTSLTDLVDSVGIALRQTSRFEVDGWGQVAVGGDFVDALRLKTTLSAEADLEAKVPVLGWISLSALGVVPDSLLERTNFSTTEYSYLSGVSRFPLFRITVDSFGRATRLYTAEGVVGLSEASASSTDLNVVLTADRLSVSPSLTSDGPTRLQVFGVDGATIASQGHLPHQGPAYFDTAAWPAGVYLVTQWSSAGLIATKRVLIR